MMVHANQEVMKSVVYLWLSQRGILIRYRVYLPYLPSDSPVCAQPTQLLGLSVGDRIDIPCTVSANPRDLTFHWFFNKTKESKVKCDRDTSSLTLFCRLFFSCLLYFIIFSRKLFKVVIK